jgi:hypothetical protein
VLYERCYRQFILRVEKRIEILYKRKFNFDMRFLLIHMSVNEKLVSDGTENNTLFTNK